MTDSPVAYRMPDPFSPGAINPTAATPTCCCCCCCCLASAIVTPVALYTSLARDTAPPARQVTWGPPPGWPPPGWPPPAAPPTDPPPTDTPAGELSYPAYPAVPADGGTVPAGWVPHPSGPAPVGPPPVPSGRRVAGLIGVVLTWFALLGAAVVAARSNVLAEDNWVLLYGVLVLLAAIVAAGFAELAGAPRSWPTGVRLFAGAVVFGIEFFVSAMVLLTTGFGYFLFAALAVGGGLYLALRLGRRR